MPKSQLFCLIASVCTILLIIMCNNIQTTKAFSLNSNATTATKAVIAETSKTESSIVPEESEGRTFGRIKRLQMLMIPIAFKMGAFSVIIGILLALAIKSVVIGKAILFLNVAFVIFKVGSLFHKPKHEDWDHKKNIHIHLHGADHGHHAWMPPEYHAQYSNIATT